MQNIARPIASHHANRAQAVAVAAGNPIGYARAIGRYFKDGEASVFGKLFVVLAIAYIVMPVDAIPDVIPFLGWLDDLGIAGIAMGHLYQVANRYRQASTITVEADPAVEPAIKAQS